MSVFLLFFFVLKSERFNERTERLVVVVVIDREKSAGCRGGGFIFGAHLSTFVVYVVVEEIFGGGGGKEGGVSSVYFFCEGSVSVLKQQKRERERKREREEGCVRARGVQLFMQFVIIITDMYSKVVIKTDHIYSRDALSNLSSPVHIRGNAFAGKDLESVLHVDYIDGP